MADAAMGGQTQIDLVHRPLGLVVRAFGILRHPSAKIYT